MDTVRALNSRCPPSHCSREPHTESLQLHVETRFEQLRVACELELWAEAFRSVEDIQQLILQAKKTPKQQMMAAYYACLTQVGVGGDGTWAECG